MSATSEILEAMRYTGRLAGIFAEPAAATAVAGLRRAVAEGVVGRRASAVALITGNGLKDVQSARRPRWRALRHCARRRRAGRNSQRKQET